MTQRTDWDSLLDALESDPNLREALRRHILTDELLNLPATVANLAKYVETIALAVGQLQTDMTSVKQEMVEMRTDIASVKGEMVEMRVDLASVNENIGQLQRGQSIQTGVLSEAAGAAYENTAIRLAPRLIRRHFGLANTLLFSHQPVDQHSKLRLMGESALDDNVVTSEDLEDLMETDMVFKAKSATGEVFILVEASLTVQASDVVRAKRRAETLNRIVGHAELGTSPVPVVIGKAISEEAQALLIGQGGESGMVTFLTANGDAPDA